MLCPQQYESTDQDSLHVAHLPFNIELHCALQFRSRSRTMVLDFYPPQDETGVYFRESFVQFFCNSFSGSFSIKLKSINHCLHATLTKKKKKYTLKYRPCKTSLGREYLYTATDHRRCGNQCVGAWAAP